MLTKEIVNNLFFYKDGVLFWKANNKTSGYVTNQGYRSIKINQKKYLAHRLVFLYHHGYFPQIIDHINNIRTDNRIENLRVATQSENCRNLKRPSHNTSGEKNVCWDKEKQKWCVRIKVGQTKKNIGRFVNFEDAKLAAVSARDKYYGKFANHT
jgi:hypothetical protein